MNVSEEAGFVSNTTVEDLAGQLTQAAYRVALRRSADRSWIELEIELWRALANTLKKWPERLPLGVTPPESLDGKSHGDNGHLRDPNSSRAKGGDL